jgi:hypothetical protein
MVSELLSSDLPPFYNVPKYQREYVWGRYDWEALLDDLLEHEGTDGHFLGTFICVNREQDSTQFPQLEVIDGQQRLTTISLALAAIYSVLKGGLPDGDDEYVTDVITLKRMLAVDRKSRLAPQIANSNRDDFYAILARAGLDIVAPKPSYMGVRRIEKAYQFFLSRMTTIATERGVPITEVAMDLLARVKRAQMVKLEVNSYSDAFTLFESLNNRGKPLTPIDLIKNSLLADADRSPEVSMDEAYAMWQRWLDDLGDDYSTQERFFRQFYNSMKDEWHLSVPRVPLATRSNLIQVYETLINRNVVALLPQLTAGADAYAKLVNTRPNGLQTDAIEKAFADLNRAEGTTAQVLLLYLLLCQRELGISDEEVAEIARLLTAFSVRRNLTNFPATYTLQRMFMEIIVSVREKQGPVRDAVLAKLKQYSASDEQFVASLGGRIYEDNASVVRFILVRIAEQGMTKETWQDLWARDENRSGKSIYRWTIEHILPQSENLEPAWIAMLGGPEEAKAVQDELVHHLGNLTITGFNSSLGKKNFVEKRDREDSQGRLIGYRNGLSLNVELTTMDSWSRTAIVSRTEELAQNALALFPLM